MALSIRSWSFVPLHLATILGNSNVHTLLLRIYLSTVSTSGNQSPTTIPLLLSFMMSTVRHSVIHVGTCPAFIHSCRCSVSLGCILVAFLNQNPCTSAPAAFQLDILAIACISSLAVMITFSCFGVFLSFSFTFNYYYNK